MATKVKINKEGKTYIFPITIEPCEEGGYFAYSPLLKGAHAEGETYAEVIENLESVIKIHLELRLKHKEFIPSLEAKERVTTNIPLPIHL